MHSDFKKLMVGRFFFTFATAMQAVILGWRMYDLTRDPLYLGLIGLVEAIPALSIALYAGYIVDRSRPLFVYHRVLEGSLLSGLVLFASQQNYFPLEKHAQVLALFAASFITGAARGFSQPAVYAIVPRIVKREDLQNASALMTGSLQVARVSGPAFGGLVFGWLGSSISSFSVCLFLIAGITCLFLIKNSPPAPKAGKTLSVREDLFSGLKYVLNHKILFPALTLDMISVLFGGVTALLPIYASDILHVGPKGLGALRAIPALGAAITSFALAKIDVRAKAGRWLFLCVAGFGLATLVFSVSHDFTLSLVAIGLSGAFDSVSMVIRTSAVQLASPDSMRGRISAVNSIFIGSSNEIGEFESGVLAKLLGTVPSAVIGSILCLVTVAVTAALSPTLRKMDLRELEKAAL